MENRDRERRADLTHGRQFDLRDNINQWRSEHLRRQQDNLGTKKSAQFENIRQEEKEGKSTEDNKSDRKSENDAGTEEAGKFEHKGKANLGCARCGRFGHKSEDCLKPVVCPRYKQEGHLARVCTEVIP